jgi:hypothetical protein
MTSIDACRASPRRPATKNAGAGKTSMSGTDLISSVDQVVLVALDVQQDLDRVPAGSRQIAAGVVVVLLRKRRRGGDANPRCCQEQSVYWLRHVRGSPRSTINYFGGLRRRQQSARHHAIGGFRRKSSCGGPLARRRELKTVGRHDSIDFVRATDELQ